MHKISKEDMNSVSILITEVHELILQHSGGINEGIRNEGMLDAFSYKFLNFYSKIKKPKEIGAFI